MANPLVTSALDLANFTAKGIWKKNIRDGVIPRLAAADPELMVGSTDIFTFTETPKAELVGEGANKGSQDGTPSKVTAKTYKVQLTYRYSDEIKFADEEYQLGLIEGLAGNIMKGLSRAVDALAIYGINPATGTVSPTIADYIMKSGNGVTAVASTADANKDINSAAAALQANGYNATGIAFDPAFAGQLARSTNEGGTPLYPELGLGFNVESFQGLQAASSDTVSAKNEIAIKSGTKRAQAIMGDFDAFKWGIARNVPLHLIEYGDPDGKGDLQRMNQVAIRAEAYIAFAIMDGKAFAVITSTDAAA